MQPAANQERRRLVWRAAVILALVGLGAVGVAIRTLYSAAFDAERLRLAEVAKSRAALIQAVARFDAGLSPASQGQPRPADPAAATLSQLSEAQQRFQGFGETGEFLLGRRDGDRIVFLMRQRHDDSPLPPPVPWESETSDPMRRALEGRSGTLVGNDSRGARVVAAYEPVPDTDWGVVAKIDLAEVQAPFLRAGGIALGAGLLLVLAGAGFFERMISPLLRENERRNQSLLESETRERELAQEITRQNLTLTQSILDTAVDAIITIDAKGGIRAANRAVTEMFGYEETELVGRNVQVLMPDPYRQEHDAYLANYARTGHRKIIGIGREVPCQRKDGSVFPGDLAVSEVRIDEEVFFTGVLRDLTERKRRERELQRAEKRVEAAEELASVGTLVAGLAHEIGTPMGVIQGHAKLLEKHVENEKAQWRLQTIQEQIGRISKIIQSLLNMARPKASERVPVALEPLLETTLSFLSEKLKRRQVEVVRDFEPTGSVTGDPERLQQLLLNLFLNAVDAMPDGGELRLRLRPDGKAGTRLDVGDTGHGIEQANLDRIFDAFYTSKEAGKGNGLGLMVASRIVADHGGTIAVESTPGQGTEFHVHLPWLPAYRGQEPPHDA